MKPFYFFLIAIGFVIAFPIVLFFIAFGFLAQSIKTGFEIGQGLFEKLQAQVGKYMTVK